MPHMASIYRPLPAFARNLEVWSYSVKQSSHHIRMTASLKKDLKLAIWGIKRAAKCGIPFDQFLKPMDISEMTLFTNAAPNIGLRGCSYQGHWFKNNWNHIQLHQKKY